MEWEFAGEAIWWRGPAPFVFVPVPPEVARDIKSVANRIMYGWGVIPAEATVGNTTISTALFPRDGTYLVPIRVQVQRAEGVEVGGLVTMRLAVATG